MRYLLFAILLLNLSVANAQLDCPVPYATNKGDQKYHITTGIGLTKLYGDMDKSGTMGTAFFLKFDYKLLTGLHIGIEGQLGSLEAISSIVDERYVTNNYYSGGIFVTAYPYDLIVNSKPSYNYSFKNRLLSGIYVGLGVSGIRNSYKEGDIYRDPNLLYTYGPIAYYDENGLPVFKEKINSLLFPAVNAGLALPINKHTTRTGRYWSAVLNAQFNFANNELLDGYIPYDQNGRRIQGSNDMYTFYSLGVRYSL
jgi:hypothetical protein